MGQVRSSKFHLRGTDGKETGVILSLAPAIAPEEKCNSIPNNDDGKTGACERIAENQVVGHYYNISKDPDPDYLANTTINSKTTTATTER